MTIKQQSESEFSDAAAEALRLSPPTLTVLIFDEVLRAVQSRDEPSRLRAITLLENLPAILPDADDC